MTSTGAPTGSAEPDPTRQADERSLGEIVSDVTSDLSTLVRQELDLAKSELKQEATRAGKGAGMLAGAGIAGHLVLVFASLALMFLLDDWMPLELAALITAVLWLAVAGALAMNGRAQLKKTNPTLPETQRSLKEDASWAAHQKS
jgi:uncharacterized membrane protein YqjE